MVMRLDKPRWKRQDYRRAVVTSRLDEPMHLGRGGSPTNRGHATPFFPHPRVAVAIESKVEFESGKEL